VQLWWDSGASDAATDEDAGDDAEPSELVVRFRGDELWLEVSGRLQRGGTP
jgi:hypothetical protein